MPHVHESVLDAAGHTPLTRLNRVTEGIGTPVYLKAAFLTPGGSVKDRAARHTVLAERDGSLRPGGVIVEGTSGNTGVGLAIAQHDERDLGAGAVKHLPRMAGRRYAPAAGWARMGG